MSGVSRPNFLILGAPKCGTSSLFGWLAGHPDIHGSTRKETFALMDADHPLLGHPNVHSDGDDAFAPYYDDAAAAAPVRMEATTHTLFQRGAPDTVAGWADSRVAVVLREPASRVFSSFAYTRNNLGRVKAGFGFADYLELVERGVPLFPDAVTHPASAYVLERDPGYSRYARWLEPWIARLGQGRVYPVIFEEMRRDPQATVQGLLDWLGLPPAPDGAIDPGARNQTVAVRATRVQGLARRLNAALPMPRGLKAGLKTAYMAVQRKAPDPLSDRDVAALARLRAGYDGDNARLSRLCGLDLSVWMSEPPP